MTWLLSLLQENLQIHLKSTQGPIEVYLCPEEVQEPHSPAKELLPSTSALSPSPDSTQLSSNSDPGITEPTASSGETRDRRWGGAPAFKPSSSVSAFVGHLPSTHVCALHGTLYKAHTRSLSQRGDRCCSGQRRACVQIPALPLTSPLILDKLLNLSLS